MTDTNPACHRRYSPSGRTRKSSVKKKDRTTIGLDRHMLPYINKYAMEHILYSEEAATKLISIGIAKVYGFEPQLTKPSLMTRAIRKVLGGMVGKTGSALREFPKTPSVHAQPGSGNAFQEPGQQNRPLRE